MTAKRKNSRAQKPVEFNNTPANARAAQAVWDTTEKAIQALTDANNHAVDFSVDATEPPTAAARRALLKSLKAARTALDRADAAAELLSVR